MAPEADIALVGPLAPLRACAYGSRMKALVTVALVVAISAATTLAEAKGWAALAPSEHFRC
jgi:hypothetical protein